MKNNIKFLSPPAQCLEVKYVKDYRSHSRQIMIFSNIQVLTKPQYYIPSPNTKTMIHKYRLYGQYSKIQGYAE